MEQFVRKQIALETGHLSCVVRRGMGPVLVLIPGSFSDVWQWDDVIACLAAELTVVVIELRGHGQSWPPPPPEKSSIEQFALDVLHAVDELDMPKFYVAGHSIGGMVALELGNVRPAILKGIVSIEGWTNCRVLEDAFQGDTDNTLSSEQRAKKAKMRANATGRWNDRDRQSFVWIWTRWDCFDMLSTTPLPILELWGDRGRERPTLRQLQIPQRDNIKVQWIEDASHNLLLERPDEVACAITNFIETAEAGQPLN